MATIDRTTVHARYARLYVGAAGSEPVTLLGMQVRDTPMEVAFSRRDNRFFHDQANLPFFIDNSMENIEVGGALWQLEVDVLKYVLGYEATGSRLDLEGTTAYLERSMKVVGSRVDGTAFTFKSFYCKPVADINLAFGAEAPVSIPIRFALLAPKDPATEKEFYLYTGAGTDTATLAAGVLTRTAGAGFHLVTSETGTTDALTSITGATLVNGEVLILAPTAGHDITLTHSALILNLFGGADWVMDNDQDWIKLQYDLSGTKWDEVGRYDAPSA